MTPTIERPSTSDLRVELIDVSERDGLQDEPVFVASSDKVEVARALAEAGVNLIEATSFVHPKWIPQLADADTLIAQLPLGPRYSALIMNRRGLERGVAAFAAAGYAAGSYDLVFVTSASPRHVQQNQNRTIDETLAIFDEIAQSVREQHPGVSLRAAVSCSFVSPWSDEPIDAGRVVDILGRLVRGGVRLVSVCDTVGSADPVTVGRRIDEVRGAFPELTLSLHLHDAAGYALANVYAGLERGVRMFEGALGGLGGCPFAPGAQGNLDSEKLARFLMDCGAQTGIDLEKLAAARRRIRAALAAARPIASPGLAHAGTVQ
ncbi:MAG: hydroxymethylglutaryl-CoA lyase [Vulcanimicrobiaceae bacterium]